MWFKVRGHAVVFLILVFLAIPGTAAAGEDPRPADLAGTGHDLNITGTIIANQTFPSRYAIPPTLIEVRVGVSETVLPGPKGEMAAGPRTIGFTADTVSLAILVIAVITASAGVWYLVRRKPKEEVNDEENGE